MQEMSRIVREYNLPQKKQKVVKGKVQKMKDKERDELLQRSMPLVIGCDLNSNPSAAAFKMMMGKDCLKATEAWYRPEETPETYLEHYKAIEL